jgi:signal transduction histidine kinase
MEDDAAQARLVRKCLEREGYSIDLAEDGAQGLVCCQAKSYAAVIIDQTMPGLSGLDVIRSMSEQGPLPPIIMVTGTGDERIAVEAMKLGASDYLVKDLEGGFINVLPLVVRRAIQERRTLLEKRQMEQELAQSRKMKAIGLLATGIAHEINTPTQYLGDNTRFLRDAFQHISTLLDDYEHLLEAVRNHEVTEDVLQEAEAKLRRSNIDYWTAEIPQAIQQSLDGVQHVAGIVGAMKEFSHPDAIEKKPADLNHVIENTIMLCYNEWKYVADVTTDFDEQLPLFYCQPSDINRVVLNLMVNAAHAIGEANHRGADGKGKITVRTRHDGPWMEIRVEDTGTGIPPEIRDRVFDLFFTTKDVGQGTGQGLAIALAIVVENYGGTIDFESEVGRGTTFIVRLPIQREERGEGREERGEERGAEQLEIGESEEYCIQRPAAAIAGESDS